MLRTKRGFVRPTSSPCSYKGGGTHHRACPFCESLEHVLDEHYSKTTRQVGFARREHVLDN